MLTSHVNPAGAAPATTPVDAAPAPEPPARTATRTARESPPPAPADPAPGPARRARTRRAPSQRKIEANRANAKKSTGPKSAAGKGRSAQNAVKHRLTSRRFLLADEEQADYYARLEALYDEFRPLSESEARLVDLAAISLWRLFRVPAMEAEILESARREPGGQDAGLGAAFQRAEQSLGRLGRYGANLQRELTRALAELRRLQAARRATQRRALRGEDEWAPSDFPLPAGEPEAPGAPFPFTAEGAERAEEGGREMQDEARPLTAENAERAEEEPAPKARNEATAPAKAHRAGNAGGGQGGDKAAGRKLSPAWHDYLRDEAERIRALAAQGLAGAPVPERSGGTPDGEGSATARRITPPDGSPRPAREARRDAGGGTACE